MLAHQMGMINLMFNAGAVTLIKGTFLSIIGNLSVKKAIEKVAYINLNVIRKADGFARKIK